MALYTDIVGTPPPFWQLKFASWCSSLLLARLRECPISRGTRYYIAYDAAGTSTGHADGSHTGSLALPWTCATPAHIDTLIRAQATNGDVRFSLKRGDKFYATNGGTGIVLDSSNVTIDAYGTGELPVISGFMAAYGGSGWTTETAGANQVNVYYRTETNNVNWFREDADPDHATRRITTGSVTYANFRTSTYAGCWCFDSSGAWGGHGANQLYVNPRVANAVPLSTSQIAAGTGTGIEIKYGTYGNRLDSVRADGWGLAVGDAQKYCIQTTVKNQQTAVVSNCVAYYSSLSSHVAGHLGAVGDSGGISTWVNNVFGLSYYSGAATQLNYYNGIGGGEFISWNNTISHGSLKNETYSSNALGQAVYHHTDSGDIGLIIVYGTRGPKYGCNNGVFGGTSGANIPTPASRHDYSTARCFYMSENYPDIQQDAGGGDVILGPGYVRINSNYTYRAIAAVASGSPQTSAPTTGACWMINHTYTYDLFNVTASAGNYFSFWNRSGGTMPTTHWNSKYVAMCPGNQNFVEDGAQSATDQFINCIHIAIGSAADFRSSNLLSTNGGFTTSTTSGSDGCIYGGAPSTSTWTSTTNYSDVGYAAALAQISAGSPSAMISAAGVHPLGYVLEYDANWNPRRRGAASSAGPYDLDYLATQNIGSLRPG
jgi:hypothetical protein